MELNLSRETKDFINNWFSEPMEGEKVTGKVFNIDIFLSDEEKSIEGSVFDKINRKYR